MRKVDVESHFFTADFQKYLRERTEAPYEDYDGDLLRCWFTSEIWEPHGPEIEDKLIDIAGDRIKIMDAAGIDVQVLSQTCPGCDTLSTEEGTAFSRRINDALSEAVKKHPDRFVGMVSLAPQDPEAAAEELERGITKLGLRGTKINSHVHGEYLDNRKFWPIFEMAEKLDTPVYLHPGAPSPQMIAPYADYGFSLAGPPLGFGAEAALHAMRLIYGGVFDEYPKLKLILGHLGEGLIFNLHRIDFAFKRPWMKTIRPHIQRLPSEYIMNNFWISTSGMNDEKALLFVRDKIGADRILFASDYPYEKAEEAAEFIDSVDMPENDKDLICHLNTEKLFSK